VTFDKVVFDIETTLTADKIWCIVCKHNDTFYQFKDNNLNRFEEFIKQTKEVIGHNIIGFDIPVLNKFFGYDLFKNCKITDTLILSRLLNPMIDGGHSLKNWGIKLGQKKIEFEQFDFFSEDMLKYCRNDVDLTQRLYKFLSSRIKDFGDSIKLEHKVAQIIQRQHERGFKIDVVNAYGLQAKFQEDMNELQNQVRATFPPLKIEEVFVPKSNNKARGYVKGVPFTKVKYKEFNLGSRQQIGDRLMRLGWKPKKKTDKGHVIVDEKVLSTITNIPEAKLINKYLMLQKRIAQVSSWIEAVKEDGRVHGKVITNGTITGRMSHQAPNMAQVPAVYSPYGKECRQLWVVDKKNKLVGVDASGLELRMLAHYMNDKEYTNEIINGDIHTANQMAAGLRSRDESKTFIYAFIYGAGSKKIGNIIGGSEADGNRVKEKFLRATPSLRSLREKVDGVAKSNRRWLKGLDGRKIIIRHPHAALNSLLQGAGSCVMKVALTLLDQYVINKRIKAYPVVNVHDEFQYEVEEGRADEFGRLAVQSIKDAGRKLKLRCELNGQYKIGNNWAETH
jgi:DNA polymerase I-like protein with 3'-5' exonuclease and polymerase domains|tara:strand:- start:555 stop:2243 length:1689 start_codon:yes stop_codon:yes gene_type:complete